MNKTTRNYWILIIICCVLITVSSLLTNAFWMLFLLGFSVMVFSISDFIYCYKEYRRRIREV